MNKFAKYSFQFVAIALLFGSMIQCSPKTGTKIDKEQVTQNNNFQNSGNQKEQFRSKAPEAGPAPIIKIGKSEQFTLDNGLKVILVENHKIPRVSYRVIIDEEAWMEGEKSGTSEIAGPLLLRGTKSRSKSDIDEAIDFIGASINSSATSLSGSALTKHSDTFLEIFSDILMNPSFPQEEFDKIVKQAASGLAASKDDPNQISANVSSVINYGKSHPYGEVMTEESLEKITLKDCQDFMSNYWNPKDAYLVMVGDLNMEKAKSIAQKYFADWKAKLLSEEKAYALPEFPPDRQVHFVNKSGAVQSVVRLTYPVEFPIGSPDRTAASVLNSILGGYFQSRINQNLRETHAYTYGARSSLNSDPIVGSFSANTSVRNEVTDSAIYELLYEVNRLRDELVGKKELEMVKNVLAGSFGRRLENPGTVASFALNKSRYNLPDDYYDTYLDKLSKVTAEEVLKMAKKYLQPEKAHLVVVGNRGEVAEKLKPFSANGEIRYYNIFGDPIVVSEEKLNITTDEIIEKYLRGLGGREALTKVNSIKTRMKGEMQGMEIEKVALTTSDGKLRVDMNMGGNPVQTQIYNQGKLSMQAMGQNMPTDEAMAAEFKYEAHPIPELKYNEWGIKGEILTLEEVNGEEAIPVKWMAPEGKSWTEYFSKSSGLKLKIVNVMMQNEKEIVQSVELSDYKPVDGIQFAHTATIMGGGIPFPLKLQMFSVDLNPELDSGLFKIE